MILKGAVLIPNIPDTSGDILDEKTIRKADLSIARKGILIDVQHKLRSIGKLLELYVIDSPLTFHGNQYPKGTLFCVLNNFNQNIRFKLNFKKITMKASTCFRKYIYIFYY